MSSPATASAATPSKRSGWGLPLFVVIIGAFMTILDSTIVNVAIPRLMAEFGASTDQVQWVATAFLMALGVVVPVSGWLSERYGLSQLYVVALGIFTLGSALSGLSQSLGQLILFRILQGVGGGLIGPITMAMVYRLVPRERIGTAMGIYGLTVAFGPALGPTLGGYLVQYVSWRLVFYINVPIGIIGMALAMAVLPHFQTESDRPFDLWGFVTSASGLGLLLLALSEGQTWGWTSESIVLMLLGAVWLLLMFVIIELHDPYPLLDLRVFRHPVFALTSVLIMLAVVSLFSGSFFVPLFMETNQGLGAFATGMALMPGALLMGALMPIAGRLYDHIGARLPAAFGLGLVTVGALLLHGLSYLTPTGDVRLWMALRFGGIGLAMMPIMTAGLSVVPTMEISRATAINNIIQRASGSLGLAIFTSVFARQRIQHTAALAAHVTRFSPAVAALGRRAGDLATRSMQAAVIPDSRYMGLSAIGRAIAHRAFSIAIDDIFGYAAILACTGMILALFIRERRHTGRGQPATAGD